MATCNPQPGSVSARRPVYQPPVSAEEADHVTGTKESAWFHTGPVLGGQSLKDCPSDQSFSEHLGGEGVKEWLRRY